MAYSFRLPQATDLTSDQQMALNEVNPIAISGSAGTGKTVVSLWRHIQNVDVLNKSSMITTYTKTLHYYILESAKLLSEEAWKYVWTSGVIYTHQGNWKVDEIIIDEAQDLTLKHLEDMKKYATDISYGADFGQQLYSERVTESQLKNLFPHNIEYELYVFFRNTYHILNFIKGVLVDRYIDQNLLDELKDNEYREGIKPIIIISNNFDKEIDKIISIINEFRSDSHNIAILLPFQDGRNRNGEIWDISYKQSVDKYYQALTNRGIICSHYYNKMNTDNIYIDSVHITTFKSSKGLEFDTVIIPQFDKMKSNINTISIINENDYYVAFTRAKRGLYLISEVEINFINSDLYEIEYLDKNNYTIPTIPTISEIEISEDEILF